MYQERIKPVTMLGMFIICAGVFCVGIKPSDQSSNEEVSYWYLWVAIMYATAVGFLYTTTTLIMKHFLKATGMSATQLNIDGFMLQAIPLAVGFFITEVNFSYIDLIQGVFVSLLSMSGNICLSKAV